MTLVNLASRQPLDYNSTIKCQIKNVIFRLVKKSVASVAVLKNKKPNDPSASLLPLHNRCDQLEKKYRLEAVDVDTKHSKMSKLHSSYKKTPGRFLDEPDGGS